jgi:hypothetical protein
LASEGLSRFQVAKGLKRREKTKVRLAAIYSGRDAMNDKLSFASLGGLALFSVAVLAGVIGGALISAVVLLFQSRGAPMAQAVAAEKVCGHHQSRWERDACVKEWLAVKRAAHVVSR